MNTSTTLQDPTGLADALFSKVRQRVLAVLFSAPDRSFYVNEVVKLAQSGTGAVQRELLALMQGGVLTVTQQGRQTHYQANALSPVFAELSAMVRKTTGLVDVLRAALAPLAVQMDTAFIYEPVERSAQPTLSNVNVLVVSANLSNAKVRNALDAAAATLGRALVHTVLTPAELAARAQEDRDFVTRVLRQPKAWLVGSEETLHALAPGARRQRSRKA